MEFQNSESIEYISKILEPFDGITYKCAQDCRNNFWEKSTGRKLKEDEFVSRKNLEDWIKDPSKYMNKTKGKCQTESKKVPAAQEAGNSQKNNCGISIKHNCCKLKPSEMMSSKSKKDVFSKLMPQSHSSLLDICVNFKVKWDNYNPRKLEIIQFIIAHIEE